MVRDSARQHACVSGVRTSFGLTETVFVMGWALVGSLVPTPGGAAGAFHAATAAALIFLGVVRETAAAVAIVMHLIDFSPALIFGLFYILRGDISLSRLRSLTSSEAVEHAVEDEKLCPTKSSGKACWKQPLPGIELFLRSRNRILLRGPKR